MAPRKRIPRRGNCETILTGVVALALVIALIQIAWSPARTPSKRPQLSGSHSSSTGSSTPFPLHDVDNVSTEVPASVAPSLSRRDMCLQRSREGHQDKVYSVVFDIGSTGNRVHVYRFQQKEGSGCAGVGCLQLENELFEENKFPLATAKNASDVLGAIDPLYQKAVAAIPEDALACTPVEFKATAGLRRIGEWGEVILEMVRNQYSNGALWLQDPKASCRILEGREEGPLAWLTVNFLLGSFNESSDSSANISTSGIVDLGGGSTQIVFEVKGKEAIEKLPEDLLFRFYDGATWRVAYQHSYDGYGLHAATLSLLNGTAKQLPCFPGGFTDSASNVKGVNSSTASFQRCHDEVSQALFQGQECPHDHCGIQALQQPSLHSYEGNFYIFSYFYDFLKDHLSEQQTISSQKVGTIAASVCDGLTLTKASESDHKNVSLPAKYECIYYTFLYDLLVDGYKMPVEKEFHVAKKLNGFETSWSLGAALQTLSSSHASTTQSP